MVPFRPFLPFLISSLTAAIGFCQAPKAVARIPSDPLELVTGPVQVADTADARASLLALLERARQNNNLHVPGGAPYDLKVSFNSTGQSAYTGAGEMEEIWEAPSTWRWTAHLGDYSQTRVYYRGLAYDANPHAYLPLRLQMVRHAIFWPVHGPLASSLIRTATANWNGTQVTCALISRGSTAAGAPEGRQWQEQEFCVDPKSGLLQTYSEVPGIYEVYNYDGALQFHGSTLARQISVVENGSTVLQVLLNSIQDAGAAESSLFKPASDMQAPGVIIRGPFRFLRFVQGGPATSSGMVEPVVIHALLSATGKVLEAEALQTSNSALSEAALEAVRRGDYGPADGAGGVPFQREAFISVAFQPAP